MPEPVPSHNLIISLIIFFCLILLNAFFTMSETAIVSLNASKTQRLAENGDRRAKKIIKFTANPLNFLATVHVATTLIGFFVAVLSAQVFSTWLYYSLATFVFQPSSVLNIACFLVVTVIVAYLFILFGERIPKKIATTYNEKIAFSTISMLNFISVLLKPFVGLLSVSCKLIVKMFGMNPNYKKENVTEEEIRMMVDVGGENGVIEEVQKEMINNIFEFDDINAGDIMTHRKNIIAIDVKENISSLLEIFKEEGFSRVPVFEKDLDKIIGVIYFKDLLKFIGNPIDETQTIKKYMRSAYFVPETKCCGDLFKEMTENRLQFAVVVDEYGGTAGVVSMEDLIESIVGNIQDEFDDEDEEIHRIDETTFTIEGTTDIEEVSEIIGFDLPTGDYDTLAGFLISNLGYIPKDGETPVVEYKNITFSIKKISSHRITNVTVKINFADETSSETVVE